MSTNPVFCDSNAQSGFENSSTNQTSFAAVQGGSFGFTSSVVGHVESGDVTLPPDGPITAEESREASRLAATLDISSPSVLRSLASAVGIPTDTNSSSSSSQSSTFPTQFHASSGAFSEQEMSAFGSQGERGAWSQGGRATSSLGVAGEHEAAEALMQMAKTPVKSQSAPTLLVMNEGQGFPFSNHDQSWRSSSANQSASNSPHPGHVTLTSGSSALPSEGATNEDSSSSSVASAVLMPPPPLTPRRAAAMYKTPKKQTLASSGHGVSPARSPGLSSLTFPGLFDDVTQSPRSSQKHLALMDQLVDMADASPSKSVSGTPRKDHEDFGGLEDMLKTPQKSDVDAHLTGIPPPNAIANCDTFAAAVTNSVTQGVATSTSQSDDPQGTPQSSHSLKDTGNAVTLPGVESASTHASGSTNGDASAQSHAYCGAKSVAPPRNASDSSQGEGATQNEAGAPGEPVIGREGEHVVTSPENTSVGSEASGKCKKGKKKRRSKERKNSEGSVENGEKTKKKKKKSKKDRKGEKQEGDEGESSSKKKKKRRSKEKGQADETASTDTKKTPKKKKRRSKSKRRTSDSNDSAESAKQPKKSSSRRRSSTSRREEGGSNRREGRSRLSAAERSRQDAVDAAMATAQTLMTQKPLGARSPLVCGMSPFGAGHQSNSPFKMAPDLLSLMRQVQEREEELQQQQQQQLEQSERALDRPQQKQQQQCEKDLGIQQPPPHQQQHTEKGIPGTKLPLSSENDASKGANAPDTTVTVGKDAAEHTGEPSTETDPRTEKSASKVLQNPDSTAGKSRSTKPDAAEESTERRPLAEKSGDEVARRGKKRRRHRAEKEKEDITPEKKKQVRVCVRACVCARAECVCARD